MHPDDPSLPEVLAAMGASERMPPPALRARVLGGIAPPPFTFARAHEGLWLACGPGGAEARMLFMDSGDRWITQLVRLPVAAALPAHSLGGARHLLVLAGTLASAAGILGAGGMVDEGAEGAATWRATEPAEVLVQERADAGAMEATTRLPAMSWTPVGPGLRVSARPAAGVTLVEAEAGAELPPHAHDGIEELFVLSGSCTVEGQPMHVGDYHRAMAGSRHGVTTAGGEGCLLYTSLRGGR